MTLYETYYDAALAVVSDAHAGMTRADRKTPYIAHPIDVAQRVKIRVEKSAASLRSLLRYSLLTDDELVFVAVLAALGHDVEEDNEKFPLATRWLQAGIPPFYVGEAMLIIIEVTNDAEDYLSYLLRLKERGGAISLILKQEDMRSNWDSISAIPSVGRQKSMRTKILLAHWILFSTRIAAA